MAERPLKQIIEAAVFAAIDPLDMEKLKSLVNKNANEVKELIQEIQQDYAERGVELVKVASGYRFQAKQELAKWLKPLYEKNPPRYSRALFETLALIAYRQPITRGEIEEVRGVAVSTKIMKTLQEREWIKAAGHRDVPGKPVLFVTTKSFLDYFNLAALADLPPLSEIMDFEKVEEKLSEQLSLTVNFESVSEEESTNEELASTHHEE